MEKCFFFASKKIFDFLQVQVKYRFLKYRNIQIMYRVQDVCGEKHMWETESKPDLDCKDFWSHESPLSKWYSNKKFIPDLELRF